MGDIYGISNSVMEANSLHGQLALERQEQLSNYQTALDKFHKKIKDEKTGDSDTNLESEGKDAPTLSSVYDLGRVSIAGGKQSALRASEAFTTARSGVTPSTLTGTTDASGGLSEASQSAFLAESSGAEASGLTEGAGVARSTGRAVVAG